MHKCKHGCGHEHKHRGAMNLHEKYHCPKLQAGGKGEQPKTKLAACDCEGGGDWTLLSGSHPAQARAIAAGYKKYCQECGEVV